MDNLDVREFLKKKEELEIAEARRMMPFRISVGQALLNDERLNDKWSDFVKTETEGIGHGILLDETLQIMGLIKADVPKDKIRESLSIINNNRSIITNLSAFIHPEILAEIDLDNDMDKDI